MPQKLYTESEISAIIELSIRLGMNLSVSNAEEMDGEETGAFTMEEAEFEELVSKHGIIDAGDFLEEFEEILPEEFTLNSDSDKSIWLSE